MALTQVTGGLIASGQTIASPTISGQLNNPTWTTGTRPASPINGTQGYNTTTGQLEIYNTVGGWQNAGTSGATYTASYLIVAGGGSGGNQLGSSTYASAGGGAGGLLTGTSTLTIGTTYSFVVGSGGAGTRNTGANGNNTTGLGLTAIGGGGGGNAANGTAGLSGGSGGGGGFNGAAGAGTLATRSWPESASQPERISSPNSI
jgi:hypothetical protein